MFPTSGWKSTTRNASQGCSSQRSPVRVGASVSGVSPDTIPRGFGWSGGAGTSWRSDLDADLTGILFTQRGMGSPQSAEVYADFWEAAYAALDS